jgi:hypothetical protein
MSFDRKSCIENSTAEYNKKLDEIWKIMIKKFEDTNNAEIKRIYSFSNFNIKYLEKYIYIMKNAKDDELTTEIEKLNTVSKIIEILYAPVENTETTFQNTDKIELIS